MRRSKTCPYRNAPDPEFSIAGICMDCEGEFLQFDIVHEGIRTRYIFNRFVHRLAWHDFTEV